MAKQLRKIASQFRFTQLFIHYVFLGINRFCFMIDFYYKVNTKAQNTVRQTIDNDWTIIRQAYLRETVILFV